MDTGENMTSEDLYMLKDLLPSLPSNNHLDSVISLSSVFMTCGTNSS